MHLVRQHYGEQPARQGEDRPRAERASNHDYIVPKTEDGNPEDLGAPVRQTDRISPDRDRQMTDKDRHN